MHDHAPGGYVCPFCRYVANQSNDYVDVPAAVVERTDTTLTFVSPKWWPNNPGHVLVIPSEHHENLYALPDEVGLAVFVATRRAALALKAAYGCDGVSTRQHNEPGANQDVWHFHTHVFPRWAGDRLYGSHGAFVTKAEMAERAALLRDAYAALP